MTRKKKRLLVIAGGMGFLALAAALTFVALGQRTSYFYMPSDLIADDIDPGQRIRLGGLVEKGTVRRGEGTIIAFSVGDGNGAVPVTYEGVLPSLFREEQGVVAEGIFNGEGVFVADTVLARHDETYMPREVANALKEQGVWQEEDY